MDGDVGAQALKYKIIYLALLGPRDSSHLLNVPPDSVIDPMLRFFGGLPQSSSQFVSSYYYYSASKMLGLQMGYDVTFVYPDVAGTESLNILKTEYKDLLVVFLLCTREETAIKAYNECFSANDFRQMVCILDGSVKEKWDIPCPVFEELSGFYNWMFEYTNSTISISKDIPRYSVPLIPASLREDGNVFSPTRVNASTLNAIIGNWGFEKDLSEEELIRMKSESSSIALADKDGTDRQDYLVSQIIKIRGIEDIVYKENRNGWAYLNEESFRAPLVIAAPYTSIEMRKVPGIQEMSGDELKMAKNIERIMGYTYTRNYTVWNQKRAGLSADDYMALLHTQFKILNARSSFFDFVGSLHASIRFSPYMRIPFLGSNINSELSFVGIKNLHKIVDSPDKRTAIRKVMEKIGRKMANTALGVKTIDLIKNDASQIVAMTDLPIEWLMIDDVPLAFSHDVCRLPETPVESLLAQYTMYKTRPYVIPADIIKKTLVIFGNEDPAFAKMQEVVWMLSEKQGFIIRKCLSKQSFIDAVNEVKPEFLIVDSHGGVDEESRQTFLEFGNDKVTGIDIIAGGIHPQLVFLSACSTFTAYNTVSTIANAFFQNGSLAVTTSYMPIEIGPSTILYTRLLGSLNEVANSTRHFDWLSFISQLLRSSYIYAPLEVAESNCKVNIQALNEQIVSSMQFCKRREVYKNLNTNSFTRGMGADYKYIIPHYLMYSTLGRADLIRFSSSLPVDTDKLINS